MASSATGNHRRRVIEWWGTRISIAGPGGRRLQTLDLRAGLSAMVIASRSFRGGGCSAHVELATRHEGARRRRDAPAPQSRHSIPMALWQSHGRTQPCGDPDRRDARRATRLGFSRSVITSSSVSSATPRQTRSRSRSTMRAHTMSSTGPAPTRASRLGSRRRGAGRDLPGEFASSFGNDWRYREVGRQRLAGTGHSQLTRRRHPARPRQPPAGARCGTRVQTRPRRVALPANWLVIMGNIVEGGVE